MLIYSYSLMFLENLKMATALSESFFLNKTRETIDSRLCKIIYFKFILLNFAKF